MEDDKRLQSFDTSGPASQVSIRWRKWVKSFEYYLVGKDISNKKRSRALLLHFAGPQVQDIIDDLLDPDDALPEEQRTPNDNEYLKCKRILDAHFAAPANPTYERHVFRQLVPQAEESTAHFCSRLRQQARLCSFENTRQTNEAVRDQIVATVRNVDLKKKLLSEPSLSVDRALELCRVWEDAQSQSQMMTSRAVSAGAGASESASDHAVSAVTSRRGQHQGKARGQGRHHPAAGTRVSCYSCGRKGHKSGDASCPAKGQACRKCGKTGHFAKCCKSGSASQTAAHHVREVTDYEVSDSFRVGQVSAGKPTSNMLITTVQINGTPLDLEVDTGSMYTLVPQDVWEQHWTHVALRECSVRLKTYNGSVLPIVGEADVDVRYSAQNVRARVIVVREGSHPLLGRDWLSQLRLDWQSMFNRVNATAASEPAAEDAYPEVFRDGLGKVSDREAEIYLNDGATPKCCNPRPVPFALRPAVNKELDRLEQEGIIKPVKSAEWASPIVIVRKQNRDIRMCADFKVTINPHINSKLHPIPNPNDLLSQIAGGSVFTKLDLSQAYAQLPLSERSQKYCVITTHRGLYAFQRLPFGVSSAPAIWQKTMDEILHDIPGVVCFYDDILITGCDVEEHDRRLKLVLARLAERGVRLRKQKCAIRVDRVRYLGYSISRNGLEPNQDKVEAILKASAPKNVQALQSFLGCVNFYNRFLPDMSSVLKPLNNLLRKGVPWNWTDECEKVFDQVKRMLTSAPVLAHFDVNEKVVVECDASPYGIGACLMHEYADGSRRPVCYVSRSLAKAEAHYSQIEREALAIVFAVKRLHIYLFGRSFVLCSDHKPLLHIFGEKYGLSATAVSRLQRWAVILSEYDYVFEHISGSSNAVADCLSRLPMELTAAQESAIVSAVNEHAHDPTEDLPIDASDVADASKQDSEIAPVLQYLQFGWPAEISEATRPYYKIRHELTIESGCVVRGGRTVIPVVFRRLLLNEMHSVHIGIVRMKAVARSFVWWPGLDRDIELLVSSCSHCQALAKAPSKDASHPWVYPTEAFERVHVDFAEFNNQQYLVIVDAYSKWIDAYKLGSTATTQQTIDSLVTFIATFGIPKTLVSDNGPQFTSHQFQRFCRESGIVHKCTPPYHPASNGQVERIVQELKRALKSRPSDVSEKTQMHRFLFMYRNTPHSSTNVSPASLLFRKLPSTKLARLKPNFAAAQRERQARPQPGQGRHFVVEDTVLVLNTRNGSGPKWLPGVIVQKLGPVSYIVRIGQQERHVHVDHLRHRSTAPPDAVLPRSDVDTPVLIQPDSALQPSVPDAANESEPSALPSPSADPVAPRRSARAPKSPSRLINEM
ncbi:uncharacterized protein K02A2.6-like [Sycon ciliatum]|uniref:uncharacterized protein K02A2.6-like n=1 Tax=Sycon ciliatum TaxID=27933 RepID=UPI0031F6A3C0